MAKSGARQIFEGKSEGPHTLRFGVEHSLDQMTVRLARDIGNAADRRIRQAFWDLRRLAALPSMSLGAGRNDGAADG